jgi:glutaminyl-peptide cyclotransferase
MKLRRGLGLAFSLALLTACHAGSDAKPVPDIWTLFDGDRAFADVKAQVDIGPRPSGNPILEKARQLIITEVEKAGWKTERQEFDRDTPRGPVHFTNIIARFGGDNTTQQAIVCSHYDTKIFDTIRFVGASDGASSTGALIELARVLAQDPGLARRVELVFFDGEEAVESFIPAVDGLYGSEHYAHDLRDSGRAKQFKFAILWDMMGPKNLDITLSPESPPDLTRGILKAADSLNLRQNFTIFDRDIYDDHVPLKSIAGITGIDLIDFNYPPWHTAEDTLDKLSPDSLRTVGEVTLYYLRTQFPNE